MWDSFFFFIPLIIIRHPGADSICLYAQLTCRLLKVSRFERVSFGSFTLLVRHIGSTNYYSPTLKPNGIDDNPLLTRSQRT